MHSGVSGIRLFGIAQAVPKVFEVLDGTRRRERGDLYDKVKEDVEFRRMWAEKCRIGFELPEIGLSVVPKVPKNAAMKKAAEAA
jgi:hypothetical protein